MANVTTRQITEDGYRNAVVKFTGVLDTSNATLTPALSLSDLTGNDPRKTLKGLRVDLVEFAISDGLEVQLAWNATSPQQMFPLYGRGRINSTNYGGFHPDMTAAGFDGAINLTTTGYTSGTVSYTIVLELIKLYV